MLLMRDLNDLDHGGLNLQGPVDDALNLVHDVVLRKQVLQIPGEDSFEVLYNCNTIEKS